MAGLIYVLSTVRHYFQFSSFTHASSLGMCLFHLQNFNTFACLKIIFRDFSQMFKNKLPSPNAKVLALKHGAALGKLGKLGNWAMENSRIEWHRNCKREYKEDRDITSTVKL